MPCQPSDVGPGMRQAGLILISVCRGLGGSILLSLVLIIWFVGLDDTNGLSVWRADQKSLDRSCTLMDALKDALFVSSNDCFEHHVLKARCPTIAYIGVAMSDAKKSAP